MQKKATLGIVALTMAALGGTVRMGLAAPTAEASLPVTSISLPATDISIPVVTGAKVLSAAEKGGVDGACGCDKKPGYGFGTTGHYGPPGQGFTPGNSWRHVVHNGGTTTPKGGDLPPTAFK